MWNDGMDRRLILQWSRLLPKEFMVKARWYRVPRSKPHLQLGCLVCWLNHKFCQWLVKMQSVWETGVPCPSVQERTAVSGRREPAQIWNYTTNRASTHQLKDFIRLNSFTRNQMHQYKRQTPLLRCLIEPLVKSGGGESVERWVEVTAEWALSAGRAKCHHRPSLSTAKGFL